MNEVKNLPYVSYREAKNLDDVKITYVDYTVDTENGTKPDVFMVQMKCGLFELENINELPSAIESFFVTKIKTFKNRFIEIENDSDLIKEKIRELFKNLDNRRGTKFNGRSEESFVILPKNLNISYDNINVINSDNLEDEIIIGKKTLIDEPGMLLVTNDDGLKDVKNLRLGLMSLGFKPEESYYILKLK